MYEVIKCNLYIRKLIWIIVSKLYICLPIAALCASVGYIYSKATTTENYYAETGFYLYSVSDDRVKSYDNGSILMTPAELALSSWITSNYIAAFSTDLVAKCIKDNINTSYSTQEILDMIEFYNVEDTPVIYARVIGSTSKTVYDIANSLAYDVPELVSKIVKMGSITTFDYPEDKTMYYTTSYTKKYVLLGGAAGFAVPFFICLLLGIRDPIIRTKDELEAITGKPVICEIPYIKTKHCKKRNNLDGEPKLLYGYDMPHYAIEVYASLRTFLNRLINHIPNCVIVITSLEEGCGKSSCALNIALSQTATGRKVLLIDTSTGNKYSFKSENVLKSSEISYNDSFQLENYDDTIVSYSDRLDILTNCRTYNHTDNLLLEEKSDEYIRRVKERYDCVIIDTPSVKSAADAYLLKNVANAYISIVRAGKSSMLGQKEMIKRIDSDEELMFGYILNFTKRKGI